MNVVVTRDGQQFGPYTPEEVRAYIASGQLFASDLAWFEGAADWMPLSSVPGLSLPPTAPARLPPPPSVANRVPPAARSTASACPQCGGSQTMKVSLAHAQGTTTSIFGGLSSAGNQTGTFGGAVVNQTALAKLLAPPKTPSIGCFSVGIVAFVCFQLVIGGASSGNGGLMLIALLGGPILVIVLARWNRAKQMPEYERARDEWERSWVCLRCGQIFLP